MKRAIYYRANAALQASRAYAAKLEALIQDIDHEVRDNNLPLGDDVTEGEREGHRICDAIAKMIEDTLDPAPEGEQ
jgi:hypothetical protein